MIYLVEIVWKPNFGSNGLACDVFVYELGHCMAWLYAIYGHGVTIKPRV